MRVDWYCFGPKRNYEHSVLDMLSCVPVTVLGKNNLLALTGHVSWVLSWAVSHMKTSFVLFLELVVKKHGRSTYDECVSLSTAPAWRP